MVAGLCCALSAFVDEGGKGPFGGAPRSPDRSAPLTPATGQRIATGIDDQLPDAR
jgi:hypothetical protein